MEDTRLLVPGEADCPHCHRTISWPPRPDTLPGNWVARHHICPACRNDWHEIRDLVTVTRYWTAVPAMARYSVRHQD